MALSTQLQVIEHCVVSTHQGLVSLLDAIEWDIRNLYDLLKARPKTVLTDRQQLLLDLGKKLIDDAYDLVHSVD